MNRIGGMDLLNLGMGISEYEDRKVIPFLWEEPEKYE